MKTTAGPLSAWLPAFDIAEYHQVVLACTPEQAMAALHRIPVASDWIVRTLFRLRGLGSGSQSIAAFGSEGAFLALEQTPRSFVFGLAARLADGHPRAANAEEWRAWAAPGLKIVADFRAEPLDGGGTRLSTETRVLALDRRSRVLFRLYWTVVGPFSSLIRRRWLAAVRGAVAVGAG